MTADDAPLDDDQRDELDDAISEALDDAADRVRAAVEDAERPDGSGDAAG